MFEDRLQFTGSGLQASAAEDVLGLPDPRGLCVFTCTRRMRRTRPGAGLRCNLRAMRACESL